MFAKLLKPRPGFTLAEVIVALTLTAIIGVSLTGVFVTQSRYFDHQDKTSFARSVSRGAMNMLISELRMLELDGALVAPATAKKITVRAPYAIGVFCGLQGGDPVLSLIPSDPIMMQDAKHSGYAYRTSSTGRYTYVESERYSASSMTIAVCTTAGVQTFANGRVLRMTPAPAATEPALVVGTPVMVYQLISYEFRSSLEMPGTIALWRTPEAEPNAREELVAPFDTSARFAFFVNDSMHHRPTPAVPPEVVTGIHLVLDGVVDPLGIPSQRKNTPMSTSVFFRNR